MRASLFSIVAVLAVADVALADFVAGNLAILRVDEVDSNAPASIVEVNKTTAGQAATSTTGLPSDVRLSGSATSTGYLSHSNDRSLLTLNGVSTTNTTSNVNALNPRGVVSINASQSATVATTYTGTLTGNPQTRSSTTLDNSTWYIADQNGIYSNGAVAPNPAGNFRSIKAFGGVVYTLQQSTTPTNIVVSTVSAPVGGTIAGLPGLTNNSTAQDFYMVQSGDNGSAFDVLYLTTNTSATAGSVLKYSLVSGNWVSNGSYTTNFGGYGLAAEDAGSGANLFVTTGTGASVANSLIRLVDTSGYNQTISVTTANNVTLFTAATGTTLKGVDFVPTAIPEASSLIFGVIACLGAALFRFARQQRCDLV